MFNTVIPSSLGYSLRVEHNGENSLSSVIPVSLLDTVLTTVHTLIIVALGAALGRSSLINLSMLRTEDVRRISEYK